MPAIFNPGTQEAAAGGLSVSGHPGLHSEILSKQQNTSKQAGIKNLSLAAGGVS